jgi:hypothetical protein
MPLEEYLNASHWFEKGDQLLQQRNVSEALHCFHTAESLGFDSNRCAASRWNCWMLWGQFERAWQESDRIEASGRSDPDRLWDGRPWNGKRVMLRGLHGLGDTIQFIRYAPLLRAACSDLSVQTHPRLITLLAGVAGVDRVTTWPPPGQRESDFNWEMQMEVTELPRAFRASLNSLPASVPYVHVPRANVEWTAERLPKRQGLRIGLCWRSGPFNPGRCLPFDELGPLFARSAHQFFNLQQDRPLALSQETCRLLEPPKDASDVRDLAALMLNLDLIITVDTMAAHLAGALGRPVWILLPFPADWRWMLDRLDSPWYPTARLFRQMPQALWSTVIAEVAKELSNY